MKIETINKLVNNAVRGGEDAGQIVSDFVQKEREIKRVLNNIHNGKNRIMEEYKNKIAELNREICETQKDCPHLETTFYPDASGNNDDDTICDWCGKEL